MFFFFAIFCCKFYYKISGQALLTQKLFAEILDYETGNNHQAATDEEVWDIPVRRAINLDNSL